MPIMLYVSEFKLKLCDPPENHCLGQPQTHTHTPTQTNINIPITLIVFVCGSLTNLMKIFFNHQIHHLEKNQYFFSQIFCHLSFV